MRSMFTPSKPHLCTQLAFISALFSAAACDDAADSEAAEDGDEGISFRACPGEIHCFNSNVVNTLFLKNGTGDIMVTNFRYNSWNTSVGDYDGTNNGSHMFTGATCNGSQSMASWDVTAAGEIRFLISATGGGWIPANMVQGTAVVGCKFAVNMNGPSADMTITAASTMTMADSTTGYKYMMTVPAAIAASSAYLDPVTSEYSVCFANETDGNRWLSVRPGLTLGRSTKKTFWTWANVANYAVFACHSGIAGHPPFWGVPNSTNSSAAFATNETVAIGMLYNGHYQTHTGNDFIMGYNGTSAPGYADFSGTTYLAHAEMKINDGVVVCRGNATAYDANRNASSFLEDGDQLDPGGTLPNCSSYTGDWDVMTNAYCHIEGTEPGIGPVSVSCLGESY